LYSNLIIALEFIQIFRKRLFYQEHVDGKQRQLFFLIQFIHKLYYLSDTSFS
jgi:hypothetical protein